MRELQVTYHGTGKPVPLGTLATDGRDVLFEFSPEALAQRLDLSPIRLPLRTLAYPDKQSDYVDTQRVPGLIQDSLPDGWGCKLMDRRLKDGGFDPATLTTLDRLAFLGADTMGALTYAPATENGKNSHFMTLKQLADEVQAVMTDESHAILAELARVGGSPGGARPKALVFFNPATGVMGTQAGQVEAGQPWLVKFPGEGDSNDSCALEEVYAQMAGRCQLGMEPTRFFELGDGRSAFGTARFDRDGDRRVHVHSLAGLLHANFRLPQLGYQDYFSATRRLTRDQRQIRKAVERCVFNILMNNRDDHAKNMAFTLDAKGAWSLAPPYDLTFCRGAGGEHFMDISGEGRAPTRSHVLRAAEAAGLSRNEAGEAIDSILESASDAAFNSIAVTLPVKAATLKTVRAAMKANRAALSK
jgi:serine/threonine-protein kinase HipA